MALAKTGPSSPIRDALATCRSSFKMLLGVSAIVNILTLTSSLFMLQVYDRVLASNSVPTLVVLSIMALVAYGFQGLLDYLRSRMLVLVGERIDEDVGPRVHAAIVGLPLKAPQGQTENLQPLRDLDAIRNFASSQGPVALFDLPWIPVYLALCFLFHPVIGLVAIGGALILIGLTYATEVRGKEPMNAALEAMSRRNYYAENAQRGAEVLHAMGMFRNVARQWEETNAKSLVLQRQANSLVGGLSAAAKTFRMVLQSVCLGVAAYLAIKNEISAGTIIAATILVSKALAPIDIAVASWKAYVAARQGYERLNKLFAYFPVPPERFQLPAPSRSLAVNDVAAAAPGSQTPIVQRVSFKAEAGQAVGIIGPSASGKSTVARALLNIWPIGRGEVLLDGASITQWTPEALGPSIGYLPQDVQLFEKLAFLTRRGQ
jgi:ATP-binding cassette subfamily C protein